MDWARKNEVGGFLFEGDNLIYYLRGGGRNVPGGSYPINL